jgi:hypothetical protein
MNYKRLEMLRTIKLELSGVKINKFEDGEKKGLEGVCWPGYEAIGLKPDGSPNCVPIKEEQSKQNFVIPSPEGGENENDFISRCMSELNEEFPDESQRAAVCYKSWRGE